MFFIRSGGRQEGCRQPRVCLASPHFILASCGGGIWGRLCWFAPHRKRRAATIARQILGGAAGRSLFIAHFPNDSTSLFAFFVPISLAVKTCKTSWAFHSDHLASAPIEGVKKWHTVDCKGKSSSCNVESEASFFGVFFFRSAEISARINSTQTSWYWRQLSWLSLQRANSYLIFPIHSWNATFLRRTMVSTHYNTEYTLFWNILKLHHVLTMLIFSTWIEILLIFYKYL